MIGRMTFTPILLALLCLGFSEIANGQNLETIKQWNLFNFNFPWDWPTSDKSLFNPEQIVTTGFEIGNNRIFIATPRLFSGVPATISTVRKDAIGDSPVLEAYPHWGHHTAGLKQYNCSDLGLISVYRLKIDSCNRLWAVDSGVSRSLEDFEVTCPPKILVYDLNTDQVVRRIDFPEEVVKKDSLFTNIIVDETASRPENHCDDVMVYITDTVAPAIVVYDSGRDLTWRLSHPSMFPDPDFAESRIGEHTFSLMDGIVGLAFDPESRTVYYQPFATDRVFAVSTEALKQGPLPVGKDLPVKLVGRKSSQGIGLGASPFGGNVYFNPFTETAIAEYNPRTKEQKVLAQDPVRLQFIADFKTTSKEPGSLYVISSRFHRFFLKNVDPKDINIRIMRISNIVPTAPVHPFGLPAVPQLYNNVLGGVHQNQVASPVWPNLNQSPKPGFSFYNPYSHPGQYFHRPAQPQYPSQVPSAPPVSPQPNPYYAQPTAPSSQYPPRSPAYSNPAPPLAPRPQNNYLGYNHPYAFEQFGVPNRNVNNPFFQLNTGEVPLVYQNINQNGYKTNLPLNQPSYSGNSNFLRRSLFNSTTIP